MDLDDLKIPANRHGYVYLTTFTRPTDGHVFYYVGQHLGKELDRLYSGSGTRICNLVDKYGTSGTTNIKALAWAYSQDELNFKEITLIGMAKLLYDRDCLNLNHGGSNGKLHENSREKLSVAHTGKIVSAATCAKMTISALGRTVETNRKIKEARERTLATYNTRYKMALSRAGSKHSDETRRKISESHKGKICSPEHAKAISDAKKGVRLGPRTKTNCDQCGRLIAVTHLSRHRPICDRLLGNG